MSIPSTKQEQVSERTSPTLWKVLSSKVYVEICQRRKYIYFRSKFNKIHHEKIQWFHIIKCRSFVFNIYYVISCKHPITADIYRYIHIFYYFSIADINQSCSTLLLIIKYLLSEITVMLLFNMIMFNLTLLVVASSFCLMFSV